MMHFDPFMRDQTAVALVPSLESEIWGTEALCPVADRSVAVDHVAVFPEMVADAA
jgi:hypothetical protein